ncbi:MAG: hypothetical protein Q9191_006990 [Dirinaria sp. TL-2023a]
MRFRAGSPSPGVRAQYVPLYADPEESARGLATFGFVDVNHAHEEENEGREEPRSMRFRRGIVSKLKQKFRQIFLSVRKGKWIKKGDIQEEEES